MKFSKVELTRLASEKNNKETDKCKSIIKKMKRKLSNKDYQKSPRDPVYYARMSSGLVPFKTPEEATAAAHTEAKAIIKEAEERIESLESRHIDNPVE